MWGCPTAEASAQCRAALCDMEPGASQEPCVEGCRCRRTHPWLLNAARVLYMLFVTREEGRGGFSRPWRERTASRGAAGAAG